MSAASTPSQPQPLTAPPGLDNATLTVLVRSVRDAVPVEAGTSPQEIAVLQQAAVAAALDYRPRNPREAMLAARIVISDRASSDCARRATLPDLPHNIVLRYHASAASLSRQSAAAETALRALQKLPAPPVLRAGSAAAVIAAIYGKSPAGPAAGAAEHPMPSGTPEPRPAAAASATKDAMPSGASAQIHALPPAARYPVPHPGGAETTPYGTARILDPGEPEALQDMARVAAKAAVHRAMQRGAPAHI